METIIWWVVTRSDFYHHGGQYAQAIADLREVSNLNPTPLPITSEGGAMNCRGMMIRPYGITMPELTSTKVFRISTSCEVNYIFVTKRMKRLVLTLKRSSGWIQFPKAAVAAIMRFIFSGMMPSFGLDGCNSGFEFHKCEKLLRQSLSSDSHGAFPGNLKALRDALKKGIVALPISNMMTT